jgi:hypothetical protein
MIVNGYRYELEYGNIAPSPTKVWFQIDYDGNFLDYEYESLVGWTRIGEEDWSKQVGDLVYYRTWESAPILVSEGVSQDTDAPIRKAHFIHKNDVKGFLIVNQHKVFKQNKDYGLSYLDFFDIKTQKTTRLLESYSLYNWTSDFEYEYLLTFDEKVMEVEPPEGVDYIFPMTVKASHKLYRIHYKPEGSYAELIYDFEDATEVSVNGIYNGKVYCQGTTKVNSFGCAGNQQRRHIVIDLESKTRTFLSEVEYLLVAPKMVNQEDITERSGWWNGYYYYIVKKRYGKGNLTPGMFGGTYDEYHYAYFLYRRTTLTGKDAVMQFWSDEDPMPNGVYYCKEMWNSSTGVVTDFVVRSF